MVISRSSGRGNAELKLTARSRSGGVPAVDVNPPAPARMSRCSPDGSRSRTSCVALSGLDPHQAIDLWMSQLRKTKSNYEFLAGFKTAPASMDADN
jgi:transcription termination factor Rho